MIPVGPADAVHKAHLIRLLTEILDSPLLSQHLKFKGGTCATMLGFLDRFSVDLDFDLTPPADAKELRVEFHRIFTELGLEVKDESKKVLEFFVKYDAPRGVRNTMKIDALDQIYRANVYEPYLLAEIERMAICQSRETMVSHKLIAPLDRWAKHQTIAGRDIYDIHHFLLNGGKYLPKVIKERTGYTPEQFLRELIKFIDTKVTQNHINEDLNTLLPPLVFQKIRKTLKVETLSLLRALIV